MPAGWYGQTLLISEQVQRRVITVKERLAWKGLREEILRGRGKAAPKG